MKKFNRLIFLFTITLGMVSCQKGFVEKNTNPYALTSLSPGILFTNAERQTPTGNWEGEATVVQQFVNAYNLGATTGFNFNTNNDNFNNPNWNSAYPNSIKLIQQIITLVKNDPAHANLYNQVRIWRAYIFMILVDTYGDVPYSDAGKAYLNTIYYPKYDKASAIYDDLHNELKSASAALSPTGDFVKEDLLYGATGNAAAQTAEWKKLGYSLLLRLGMRYSKLDAAKAKSIVQEAFAGGVMSSNSDDAFILFNATYNNPLNAGPRGTNPYFYYLAAPFVTTLKTTNDPRLKYVSGKYSNPNQVLALTPDTTSANQYGFPVGYDQTSVATFPGYRGTNGTGQNYSQLNYTVFGSAIAPILFVTNAQTQLLLAEAAFSGWITGGLTAGQYYNAGVQASMDEYSRYPNTPSPAIPLNTENSYLNQAGVTYSAATALNQINTQYWIASFGNGPEAFANFRRSGFPALTPNAYNNSLQGGFVRRFAYPISELSANAANYQAAVASIGGSDNLTTRIFWDK